MYGSYFLVTDSIHRPFRFEFKKFATVTHSIAADGTSARQVAAGMFYLSLAVPVVAIVALTGLGRFFSRGTRIVQGRQGPEVRRR